MLQLLDYVYRKHLNLILNSFFIYYVEDFFCVCVLFYKTLLCSTHWNVQRSLLVSDHPSSNPAHGKVTILCDKVCQWLAAGRWFLRVLKFPPPVSKTDCHKIAEILLKVVLNTIAPSDHDISKDIHIHRITAFWRSKQNIHCIYIFFVYSLTRQAGILVKMYVV